MRLPPIITLSTQSKKYIEKYAPIIRKPSKYFYQLVGARLFSNSLINLAQIYGTGKYGDHYYATHYEHHFRALRKKRLKILEIGVGGYDDPSKGGNSLHMWKAYFPNAQIFGIDIHDKSTLEENRIRIFHGSQSDPIFLEQVISTIGTIDIVIDDGSHINEDVIFSFNSIFPFLSKAGIYVVEDTQTSYWPKYGGDSYNLNREKTIMGYFKSLVDGLNYEEVARSDFFPSYSDQNISSVHFYHNMVFIYKGPNQEGSRYAHKHKY